MPRTALIALWVQSTQFFEIGDLDVGTTLHTATTPCYRQYPYPLLGLGLIGYAERVDTDLTGTYLLEAELRTFNAHRVAKQDGGYITVRTQSGKRVLL